MSGNGILLRADLHRLFDAYLLTLEKTPDGVVVRCSPELDGSWYAELDGRRIIDPPTERAVLPRPESLSAHQAECGWLKASGGEAETINP